MEESSREFKAVAPKYIHRREVFFDSGAKVKNLENVTYISLDTCKEKKDNEISSMLDAWLTFFTAEKPDEVLRLLKIHPEFLPMYKEITEFRKDPEEVIGMFSEALKIMDRNTTKYMIDELHETITEKDQKILKLEKNSFVDKQAIEKLKKKQSENAQTIEKLEKKQSEDAQTIEKLEHEKEEDKQIIIKLQERVRELENGDTD